MLSNNQTLKYDIIVLQYHLHYWLLFTFTWASNIFHFHYNVNKETGYNSTSKNIADKKGILYKVWK